MAEQTLLCLRQWILHAFGVHLDKVFGLLLFAPLFQREVGGMTTNSEGTAWRARGWSPQRSGRTGPAVCRRELNLDHLVFPIVYCREPTDAGVSEAV